MVANDFLTGFSPFFSALSTPGAAPLVGAALSGACGSGSSAVPSPLADALAPVGNGIRASLNGSPGSSPTIASGGDARTTPVSAGGPATCGKLMRQTQRVATPTNF